MDIDYTHIGMIARDGSVGANLRQAEEHDRHHRPNQPRHGESENHRRLEEAFQVRHCAHQDAKRRWRHSWRRGIRHRYGARLRPSRKELAVKTSEITSEKVADGERHRDLAERKLSDPSDGDHRQDDRPRKRKVIEAAMSLRRPARCRKMRTSAAAPTRAENQGLFFPCHDVGESMVNGFFCQ